MQINGIAIAYHHALLAPWSHPCSFNLLGARGLSFDFHVNWTQLEDAAAFLARYPDVSVILDHLGCVKLDAEEGPAEDERRIAKWRAGMRALAALPNVRSSAAVFRS